MSELFIAFNSEGAEITVADMSNNKAFLYYEITKSLEKLYSIECGVTHDSSIGEFFIDKDKFLLFIKSIYKKSNLFNKGELLGTWLSYSVGIIENIYPEEAHFGSGDKKEVESIRYKCDDL